MLTSDKHDTKRELLNSNTVDKIIIRQIPWKDRKQHSWKKEVVIECRERPHGCSFLIFVTSIQQSLLSLIDPMQCIQRVGIEHV
jgi:hypothetical protein